MRARDRGDRGNGCSLHFVDCTEVILSSNLLDSELSEFTAYCSQSYSCLIQHGETITKFSPWEEYLRSLTDIMTLILADWTTMVNISDLHI